MMIEARPKPDEETLSPKELGRRRHWFPCHLASLEIEQIPPGHFVFRVSFPGSPGEAEGWKNLAARPQWSKGEEMVQHYILPCLSPQSLGFLPLPQIHQVCPCPRAFAHTILICWEVTFFLEKKYIFFFIFRERERKHEWGKGAEGDGEADSPLNRKPRTLKS